MKSARNWMIVALISYLVVWRYWDMMITELREQNSQLDYLNMELREQIKRNDEKFKLTEASR